MLVFIVLVVIHVGLVEKVHINYFICMSREHGFVQGRSTIHAWFDFLDQSAFLKEAKNSIEATSLEARCCCLGIFAWCL